MSNKKAVLAFSGGLDTSVCVKYLQNNHKMEVITATVDCGQNDDFEEIRKKSKILGAIKHFNIDAKKEFVENYVGKSIKANGLYQGKYPLATALARPLMAEKIMDVAAQEEAIAVAHGCTGKGNDQVRFDIAMSSIDPTIKIIAPIREMNLTRDLEIRYAKKNNVPLSEEIKKYSTDMNIWGRAIEAGKLEDPWIEPPEEIFSLVKNKNIPAEYLELEFDKGVPVAVDNRKMSLINMITYLNTKAGSHGIGVIDHIEDRVVGIKTREIYEAPAALTILAAHKDLEQLVLTKHELRFKQIVDDQWSWLVYSGLWFDPLREDLDKFIEATQNRVTGKVRMKLQNGSAKVVGRKSKNSLYRQTLATYASDSIFDQNLAKGFIELWGMETVIANKLSRDLPAKGKGVK
ncbi:MAG TPA: argininosuccinate synthase [Nitrososphaeraceae archaeon]|nr:argininosuccinate synthase [Nitrososphaeraceae archaeon]